MGDSLRSRIALFVAVLACLSTPPALALDIGGAFVWDYTDYEGGTQLTPGTQHGQFRVVTGVLALSQRLSDDLHTRSVLTLNPGRIDINEAWIRAEGLPWDGTVTLGRFQKPGGAPILTAGSSYPQVLFHSAVHNGLKINMEQNTWNGEVGIVNQNDLSGTGSTLSNSAVFTRPMNPPGLLSSHLREVYVNLGWSTGGDWGSLVLDGMLSFGQLTALDRRYLNSLAIMPTFQDKNRRVGTIAADYTYGPWRAFGEYGSSFEGELHLVAWNAGGAYRLSDKLEVQATYDQLNNNIPPLNRTLYVPMSWQRNRIALGGTYTPASSLEFRLLYEFNQETFNGAPSKRGIPNDGVVFQTVAYF